ncbi:hypothetical protein H8356DRAFT_1422865 [Neocallimastix lanati (nom. inval.)]|nr:hypothetical protein H8356DRAFT_1422865 [Neocallimastix sp. JGI-2020a]
MILDINLNDYNKQEKENEIYDEYFNSKMENSPHKKYLIIKAVKNVEEIFEKSNINWNITDEENKFTKKEVEELYDERFLYTNFTGNYENI